MSKDNIVYPSANLDTQFARFFEAFVRRQPKRPYFQRFAYDQPFYQVNYKKGKARGKPRTIGGPFLTNLLHRHLDNVHYYQHNYKPYSNFWLGLGMPAKTHFHNIDIDAKECKIGSYQYHMDDDGLTVSIICPLVLPSLEYCQRLEKVYDNFPDRIWCISSLSLGVHAWARHALQDTLQVRAKTQAKLHTLGLGAIEVHPMPGRCLRVPFGTDYRTITPTDYLDNWQDQVDYFFEDARTPPFHHIIQTILDLAQRSYCEATSDRAFILDPCDFKKLDNFPRQIRLIESWLANDCPDLDTNQFATALSLPNKVPMPSTASEDTGIAEYSDARVLDKEKTICKHDLSDWRFGNWVFRCEEIAKSGLIADDSVAEVTRELAAWLLWVELFDQPDKILQTQKLLTHFITHKHNGFISRGPDNPDVLDQLDRTITTALHQTIDSKEQFALVRNKRDTGRYSHIINIQPLILGEHAQPLFFSLDYKCDRKDPVQLTTLPTRITQILNKVIEQERMRRVKGEYPFLYFATRFLSTIWQNQGKARINRAECLVMSGTQKPHTQLHYKNLLVGAGLIQPGWENTIRRGKCAALYRLTDSAMLEFQQVTQRQVS